MQPDVKRRHSWTLVAKRGSAWMREETSGRARKRFDVSRTYSKIASKNALAFGCVRKRVDTSQNARGLAESRGVVKERVESRGNSLGGRSYF